MTTLVAVCAHPRADSFCAGLFAGVLMAAQETGVEVLRHDLYADGFDPVLTAAESLALDGPGAGGRDRGAGADPLVGRYQAEVATADRLVVVHPNWWGKPPAILAGWIDRVLAPDVAYKLDGGAAGEPSGQLDLSALVVTTGDTDHGREAREFGDPLGAMWERCVLPYVGAQHFARIHVSPVTAMTPEQRTAAIREVRAATIRLVEDPARLVSLKL
jgi:putative NADPH-quinone reductase